MERASFCSHTDIAVGRKVNDTFLSYFHNNNECIVNFGEYGEWTEWNVGSCYDGETIIRVVRDYTCD